MQINCYVSEKPTCKTNKLLQSSLSFSTFQFVQYSRMAAFTYMPTYSTFMRIKQTPEYSTSSVILLHKILQYVIALLTSYCAKERFLNDAWNSTKSAEVLSSFQTNQVYFAYNKKADVITHSTANKILQEAQLAKIADHTGCQWPSSHPRSTIFII